MKDIKTLIIGFLLATCMFLMMGQNLGITPVINLSENQNGRYQVFTTDNKTPFPGIFIVDTSTGQMWKYQKTNKGALSKEGFHWQQTVSPGNFRD